MKLIHYTTLPPVGHKVFALNANGYLSVVEWDGNNYIVPDCSDTERKNEKQSFFWGTVYNPQKTGITNNISYWIDLDDIAKSTQNAPIYNSDGLIKRICMRKNCHQPIYTREYIKYDSDNPLFCRDCWFNIYCIRDLLVESRKIKPFSPEWYELEKDIKREFYLFGNIRSEELIPKP